jgi:hypothetical protein
MDFYNIGASSATKVFAQLGELIEADEKTIVFSDLPLDLIHEKIGAYLLEDPNKKIHKIFKGKEDDDLQRLLFGEVKDLTYVNIYNSDNTINYPMNDKLKDYVNYILDVKGAKITLEKMKINFYIHEYKYNSEIKVRIEFYNKKDIQKVVIENVYYVGGLMGVGGGYNYLLNYRHNDKWNKQKIQKKDIIQEYNKIREEIIEKYF